MSLFARNCSCGLHFLAGGCRHCDWPQPEGHLKSCDRCRTQAHTWSLTGRKLEGSPHPPASILKDMHPAGRQPTLMDSAMPIGAVGVCAGCGGRTYNTTEGPWCPRAGCTSASQEA